MNELLNLGFILVGSYHRPNGQIQVQDNAPEGIQQNIYALVSQGKVKYIGRSIAGPNRALTHHQNEVMATVLEGLQQHVSENNSVQVYIQPYDYTPDEHPESQLDANKQAFIQEFNPEWNIHHNN